MLPTFPQLEREVFAPRRPSAEARLQLAAQRLAEAMSAETIALEIPSYMQADLPAASDHPNRFVLVLDGTKGLARSTAVDGGWRWVSQVDGSNLGAGG